MNHNLNEDSVLDFLDFGMMSPGHSFFMKREYFPSFNLIPPKKDFSSKNFLTAFRLSIESILKKGDISEFALSGGADTRLICSVLLTDFPSEFRKFRVYTRVHPYLGTKGDRDYLIAESLSKRFRFTLTAEVAEKNSTSYLRPLQMKEKPTKNLSGLWGGECLGGALLNFKTADLKEILQCERVSPLKSYLQTLGLNDYVLENQTLQVYYHLLNESQATTFYYSLNWFIPKGFSYFSETPFINEFVLNEIFSLTDSQVSNYRIYNEVLSLLSPGFLELPINNTAVTPSFRSGLENYGIEPKTQSAELTKGTNWSDRHQELKNFCEKFNHLKYSEYLRGILPHLNFDKLETYIHESS